MKRRLAIYHVRKNERIAYAILILMTLLLTFTMIDLNSSAVHFQPVNRSQLYKIIAKNHPDMKLVRSIIHVESQWNSDVVSHRGAVGLMQVMPKSAEWLTEYSREDLFCPEKNIIAGCRILKYYQRISPDLRTALTRYSGGAEGYYEKVMAYKRRM